MEYNEIDFGFPEMGNGKWNVTIQSIHDLRMDAHMIWLLCSLLSCITWLAYITFYNSRLIGFIITKIVNKWFINGAYFRLGSLTISPLAGKIMFRDLIYVHYDYSIRVQDGYVIFRWWRSYVPKDVSEDLSHSDTRLSVQLNGFELHIYNRSELYDQLERIFGLSPSVLVATDCMSPEEKNKIREHFLNMENDKQKNITKLEMKKFEAMTATTWRDLIPVIKVDICSGRFVFGNRLTPTTLSISVEEAHCMYSTKPAACRLDHFMHFVKAKIENAKVMFAPSLKYTGLVDEPPRYMGEGFVVMMSNFIELYFYMDEPGIVQDENVRITLANGDIVEPSNPMWGIELKCGKGTDFSYGPWADRQRDKLFNFFFPSDWQIMKPTPVPKPGELRKYQSFDISLCILNEATVDILFSKEKETNAMHVTIGPGSCIEITIPWITQKDGYSTKVSGQLLHVEATTSLQYRSLAEFESLQYKIDVHYPNKWNDCQDWSIHLTGCKATAYIVYKHKSFFQELIEDWSSKSRPDILTFVPYVCKFTILLKEFEILTLSNEYNWIDCSSTNQENNHLAFCGDLFDLSFELPFDDFLPPDVKLKFWIHGEGLDLSLYIPEISSSRLQLVAIDESAKILTRSGKIKKICDLHLKKWRRICQRSGGWIDCWNVPIVAISIQYVYHPIPPLGPDPQADITTPEKEEILLSPMRFPKLRKSPVINCVWGNKKDKFDPTILQPDHVTVDVEIGSSLLLAYGSILRNFINLKENIFGDDQEFTDMEKSSGSKSKDLIFPNPKDVLLPKDVSNNKPEVTMIDLEEKNKVFDCRLYRPLHVTVSVIIHDIQAHIVKNCNETDPPCPIVSIERLGFEMKKRFSETELQVLVSPSYLISCDNLIRNNEEKHLKQGHMLLSACQVRGHAMFSNEDCKLNEDTLEYAWLLEIQLGKISGKLTLPQLSNIIIGLDTFIFFVVDKENCIKSAKTEILCHHRVRNNLCSQTNDESKYKCPSSEDIKYRMTRVAIDAIDLYIVEHRTAVHTWVSPIRLAFCNLHGQKVKSGVSGLLPSVLLRFFVETNETTATNFGNAFSNKYSMKNIYKEEGKGKRKFNTFSHRRNSYENKADFSRKSQDHIFECKKNDDSRIDKLLNEHDTSANWLEIGSASLGPLLLEMASALPIPDHKLHLVQHNFLKRHDLKFKRLWFLWTNDQLPRCGCTGGCVFFGSNRNGPKFFKPNAQDVVENINISRYQILKKSKEYGFGESILHEDQLVFHTPPYSLYQVSLHENSDCIGRLKNLKKSSDQEINLDHNHTSKKIETLTKKSINTKIRKNIELTDNKQGKRYSSNISRQSSAEVPYSRLSESPKKIEILKERRGSDSKTNFFLNISENKSSISDSRLTTDDNNASEDLSIPFEMSHSAPHHSHPLEFDLKNDYSKASDVNMERTISLTSENPSEMFFSANEEDTISRGQIKTNSSSSQRKIFLSDSSRSPTNIAELTDDSCNQRVPNAKRQNSSEFIVERSSSETPSFSSTSFMSAMSSQEDVALIQLHNNKPIISSPILMGCYLNYLPQLKCTNWSSCSFPAGADGFSTPLFFKNESGGLTYIGNRMVPKFDVYHCWREFKILPKYDPNNGSTNSSNNIMSGPKSHPWDPNIIINEESNRSSDENNEFLSLQSDSANICTSIVIRLKGQVSVFITPLLLESVQGVIETVIPIVSNLPMLTVTNLIHSSCIRKVTNDNILKRDENLGYWSQCWLKSKRSTTERSLQAPGDTVLSDVYEESISSKIQGVFILPKITITLLQASIVDEICSLTALDNLQDLNCVSLLALHIEGISTKFHLGKTTKASIHKVYINQSVRSDSNNKKNGIMKGTKAFLANLSSQVRPDNDQGEPILIETSENQLEEVIVTLDVGRAHVQLRRLNNDSNENSQVIVTAIPEHRSKAMFECIKVPETAGTDENPGYIMLECGLEGVAVKIVKRSLLEKSENSKDEDVDITSDENMKLNKLADVSGTIASTSRADFAWRLISKKPPTPKTPREKFAHALEHIIITGEAAIKDTKNKHIPKLSSEDNKEFSSNEKPADNTNSNKRKFEPNFKEADKTSSCVIDLKCVWFNFAAPPCVPITRRIDLTRLDWNLLSTLSPAITSWINSSNRFAMKIVALQRALHLRFTSLAAALMAAALENEKIQRKIKTNKSRYSGIHTLLSKTLQEDPSCQLCVIMQKLLLEGNIEQIEQAFKQGDIPHISILRQGVIVLSRQWKNILYNPILFEHQYKNKFFNSIRFPFDQKDDDCEEAEGEFDDLPPHETSDDNENALLLGQEVNDEQFIYDERRNIDINEIIIEQPPQQQSFESSPNMNEIFRNKTAKQTANILPPSTRSSIQMLPIISGLVEKQTLEIEYGQLPEGSLSSNSNSISKFWNNFAENDKDDLYFWMAKQEEKKQKKETIRQFSKKSLEQNKSKSREFSEDSIRLLDAHLIFEPLLSCLGVMPQQMVKDISTLENFGTNLSIIGTFESIRVDIVVSEAGGTDKKQQKQKLGKKPNSKLNSDPPSSFLCERVGIELELCQISDGLADKQGVMYISRRQMKKHISSVINFSLNIRFISQQVNMPLLRLLHQITNMYQTVKEAQTEFQQDQPELRKKSIIVSKEEVSLTSETMDMLDFGSVSDRFTQNDNSSDEKYDKFKYVPINYNTRMRHPSVGPLLTPPLHTKNRPQSFAQKLRSTGKSVKGKLGYTNLNETRTSPLTDSNLLGLDENATKLNFDRSYSTNTQNNEIPNCWKTIYHLLDLYGNIPTTKMIQRSFKSSDDNDKTAKKHFDKNETKTEDETSSIPQNQNVAQIQDKTRLMIFGVVKIHKTRLLATLSGLKLEAEITTLNSSVTWRKKTRPVSLECSLTGQVGRAMIVLLEGAPNQQLVVKIVFGKSQTLYSSITKRGKDKNSGLLSIGPVNIDIPQHPVALHGMMTRSSKQISSTLQELRVGRTSARSGRGEDSESPFHTRRTKERTSQKSTTSKQNSHRNLLLQPLVMQFNILLQSLSINAALLPSLQAQYKMNHVSSTGMTGSKAKFIIDLPSHTLSFATKIQSADANIALPSEACIPLPPVHVKAEYISESNNSNDDNDDNNELEGIILRQGGYVNASAEIGEFERCLTTELLNHLVFVQKVFMREVNEVIQKLYGSEKPVNIWLDGQDNENNFKTILFSLNISIKRIQLTATTPCSSAVRFETESMNLHISNRVGECHEQKLFGKAHVDFNLALGQIIKNVIFDEAEPEFQQYAFFHTAISLRNAFQDEFVNEDKELILLTLKRPLVYIQPIAIDKAILVWLNYKNAYEYWADKRANLNSDQGFDKVHFGQLGNIAASNLSMLYLHLSVEDMGICLPLNSNAMTWMTRSHQDFDPKGAVLMTLENTIISACNSGSLVSKGKFFGLCLRFADDFETTLDDWKPNMSDPTAMNLCIVSEGTYEVCSRTVAAKNADNAKWFLNVKWAMEGVDIGLDVNIGKQLSALGQTLTMITGFEEDDENNDAIESPASDEAECPLKKRDLENLPSFVFDPTIDFKQRSIMMEKEMGEQSKIINDLRTLGASHNTIAHEERRLQELQALCYKYFRRDILQRLKRPSIRRPMLKTTNRSQSFVSSSLSEEGEEQNKIELDPIMSSKETYENKTSATTYLRSESLYNDRRGIIKPLPQEAFMMRQTSLPNSEDLDYVAENVSKCDEVLNNQMLIDGTAVELRNKKFQSQKPQEPNIDFELDIKVFVNSGKCVLHTKETEDNRTASSNLYIKHHKRERSFGNDWGSPTPSRRHRDKSKLRYNANNTTVYADLTVFHIPGLDIKLHYQSKTVNEDVVCKSFSTESSASNRRMSKKASLFAWMTLQSIPEETIISPHILEFLEQTLEPIPTKTSTPVSLDLLPENYVVYSSFNVDVIVYLNMQPSKFRFSCLPVSRVECMLQLPSLNIVFSSKRFDEIEVIDSEKNPSGGLSITGCLADFNVCVYHPYTHPNSKKISTDGEKKASLSINVEFVKFHITRLKKINYDQNIFKKPQKDCTSRAAIRFSTLVDIGSASFKYDMRKLAEILAFPKAWYRRKIVRRLFLGDLSVKNENNQSNHNLKETKTGIKESALSENDRDNKNLFYDKQNQKPNSIESDLNQTAWETLVLFGVNFTKLNVQMNMGNVMGNVMWLTKDFQSDGRLVLSSADYKNMYIGIHLGGSSLDAKGGIVGGNIELNKINTQFRIREEHSKEPHHLNHLIFNSIQALELRLDYMGTSVLMSRISDFSITLRDEWTTQQNSILKLKKNNVVLIHGDVSWDQFQIMISKSTTVDLLKMFFKLEEFFTQQFKSSKRVFSNLEPRFNDKQSIKAKKKTNNSPEEKNQSDSKHHHHWQKPLDKILVLMKKQIKSRLGGTVELQGNNISLACFHGVNFKSKSWAIFSLKEPCINFSTEAHLKNDAKEIVVVQKLTVSLGQCQQNNDQNHSMAIVSRITRNVIFPPQFKILNEWFQYAFANSDIDAVDRFPILGRDKEVASNSIERSRTASASSVSKAQEHNHNREVVFALPSLQFNFKTEHLQGSTSPLITEPKPVVTCSFITEFDDHIFVTVDADAFFFLHDLISSYVKEKEKMMGTQNGRASSPNLSGTAPKINHKIISLDNKAKGNNSETKTAHEISTEKENSDLESFMKDWRHFECKTWHLEPTVRLLSWAGKSIEPYGIDYILNKLGFSHARTTIPKWLQRGFMDPFDKIQAVLMFQLLNLVKENKNYEKSKFDT